MIRFFSVAFCFFQPLRWHRKALFQIVCRAFPLLLLVVLLPGSTNKAHAQYFIRGQDPGSIRWKQLETPHFRVIFPEDYKEGALYVTDILSYSYDHASATLAHHPRKVPVILHNQTVIPNGFVSWAPARLEMFTNPPPGNDQHGWLERLAVHEFRHVVQVDMLNQGVTGFFSRIFGEHITGLSLGLFVPLWLLEGDAVVAETALTRGGRGRRPSFEQGLRAQVLEKGTYPYDKAVLGSFKDHVPNHYELGYQLVASVRAHYGADIWGRVMEHVARRPHSILPFSGGLKKHTGIGVDEHYHQTFQLLDSLWTRQMGHHTYTPFRVVNRDKELYTHYRPMAFINDTTLMVLKSGMGDIPRVIRLYADGEEEVLFTPGFFNSDFFSMSGGLVAWSEIRVDPRWEHRSWSEIHTVDLDNGHKRRITRGTRFFSPAVSPDRQLIAVTEVTSRNDHALVILNASTGREVYRMDSPGNVFLMDPQWHPCGEHIVLVAQDESGKQILYADLASRETTALFHAGRHDLSRPRFLDKEKLVFNGTFSGIDNIYMLDMESGEAGKLVSGQYGGIDGIADDGGTRFVWSDYTAMGYQAVVHDGGLTVSTAIDSVMDHSVGFHRVMAAQEGGAIVSERNIPRQEHKVSDYRKGLNLFRFHSWGPFVLNAGNTEVTPGVSLFSQNLLSTSVVSAGYEWDVNERLGKYYMNYRYMGRYPVADITAESGHRRSYYKENDNGNNNGKLTPFLWRERSMKLALSIPMRFRYGAIHYGFTPLLRLGVTHAGSIDKTPDFFRSNEVYPFEYRLLTYWQTRSVARDIRPRFGQVVDLQYRHTPVSGTDMGSVIAARVTANFPGLARHHSLRLQAAYQERTPGERMSQTINFGFPNLVVYPRGTEGRYDVQTWSFSGDYAFPVAYPEWTVPNVIYIKRIHLNLFGDYAMATRQSSSGGEGSDMVEESLKSAGIDIVGNMHFFRFFSPVDVGLRTICLPGEREVLFRLLFVFEI